MPRTEEAAAFFHAVYAAISEIPPGRVTSYGHIATLIGTPQRPRQVGVCLKHLPSSDAASPSSRWTSATVPWQRVVNAKGVISPRGHPAAVRTQAELLRDEGVEVHRGGLGELSVDLEEYGWFPSILPSEAEGRPVQDEEEEGMFVKQEEAMVKKEEESD